MIQLRENNPYSKGRIEYLNDTPNYSLERDVIVFSPSENDQIYVVTDGETLGSIAGQPEVYNDSKWWFIIADANNLAKDSLDAMMNLEPGINLLIPDLIKYLAVT